jgi:hypothetical protein
MIRRHARRSVAFHRLGASMTPTPKLDQDCYIVRDHNGQALACVYFEDEPGRRSTAHLMTRDEARRVAASAKLVIHLVVRLNQMHPLQGGQMRGNAGIDRNHPLESDH